MSVEKKAKRAGFDKGAFYRTIRMLHAYLSAFAFIALIFFSATGVMLNHPEWFEAYSPHEVEAKLTLSPAELAVAKGAPDVARAIGKAVAAKASLPGAYGSGDVDGGKAIIRFDGPKGTSDVTVDMATGDADLRTAHASFNGLMMDLHRGKNSGVPWKAIIDATAYIVLALSLLGYILFFSLRFRLKTSLILTAASLLGLSGVILWLVP